MDAIIGNMHPLIIVKTSRTHARALQIPTAQAHAAHHKR